ncbi:hypothetical protein E3N88_23579 [Mikania micrantha]|uniref:Retrotransposon gag domain-containing protein n=1 Tax=Mikania micrantha TaxID=192012 RepID=A0A5N6NGB9_9ASTR|nr:hypothetical protein E3N88_23579 [Mikania micrantha]
MADNNDERLANIITQQISLVLPNMVTQLHNSLSNSSNNSQDHPHNNTGENLKTFTFKQFNDARPQVFSGTEGAIGLLQWFESIEDTLDFTNCPEDQKVKMAASAFQKEALTWWNTEKRNRGRDAALGLSWVDFKALLIDHFCPKHEIKNLEDEMWTLA